MSQSGTNPSCPNGSQFYITLRKDIDYLDGKFTIFGVVEEDASNVLERLNNIPVDNDCSRPYSDIRVLHTLVLDDPFPDSGEFLKIVPPTSPKYPSNIPPQNKFPTGWNIRIALPAHRKKQRQVAMASEKGMLIVLPKRWKF